MRPWSYDRKILDPDGCDFGSGRVGSVYKPPTPTDDLVVRRRPGPPLQISPPTDLLSSVLGERIRPWGWGSPRVYSHVPFPPGDGRSGPTLLNFWTP